MQEQHYSDPEIQKWLDGQLLLLIKPLGWTSFDLVKKVRSSLRKSMGFKKIKVGHAGTLDPLASGLMILCTGKATKKLAGFQDLGKEYLASIRFGGTTPSFDLETEIDHTYPFEHITPESFKLIAEQFTGPQMQLPPLYSAKKIAGKRAYDYARDGEIPELRPHAIVIDSIELLNFNLPDIDIKVACSKGTYIRSLARDIGKSLDSGAHLAALSRTKIGPFLLDDALKIEEFEKDLAQV